MSTRKKDRRAIRAAIVKAAAKRHVCKVEEIFIIAMPDESDIKVNLNKIPDAVIKLARKMIQAKHPAHPRSRMTRERYYRAAPYLSVC